jgi:hypothetical protein
MPGRVARGKGGQRREGEGEHALYWRKWGEFVRDLTLRKK